MTTQDPQSPVELEKKEIQPPSSAVQNELERLKEKVPEKPSVMGLVQNIKEYFANLDPAKKKQIAAIVGTAIFGLLFAGEKKEDTETEKGADEDKKAATNESAKEEESENENENEEGVEDKEELVSRPKRSEVVCNDARLICINTDPAKNRRPSYLKGKSSYLCEYGLPNYDTFKEEMIGFLAPDADNEEEALKKTIGVLQRSPMGKYQCTPQYLFKYVKLPFQGEEGLKAMWKFLQDEKLQREACRGYVKSIISALRQDPRFDGDPRYVYASYYGGLSAGKALLATDTRTATEKERHRVSKKQGIYISIDQYAGKKGGSVNIDAIVDGIAGKESHYLEGVKSKPRDERWEQDQRFAYNQTEQTDNETAVA